MSRGVVTQTHQDETVTISSSRGHAMFAQGATLDPIEQGDVVEVVDMDNLPPWEYKESDRARLLPARGEYTYQPAKRWYGANELIALQKVASLAMCWFYIENWRKNCPLYRRATITRVESVKYVYVNINRPHLGDTIEKRCRVDYMTCDATNMVPGDEVIVKFINSDIRRGVVVGFWNSPRVCEGYLYFALRASDFNTLAEDASQSSESLSESSSSESSADSLSSASEASETEYPFGEPLVFVWDPSTNNFAEINGLDGEPINFPCKASEIAHWTEGAVELSSSSMSNLRVGDPSVLRSGYGDNKTHFYDDDAGWFIEGLNNRHEGTVGGSPVVYDDCTPVDNCGDVQCKQDYGFAWLDFYSNVYAWCGESSCEANRDSSLSGESDYQTYFVSRSCEDDGGDSLELFDIYATSRINSVKIPGGSNQDVMGSFSHTLDSFRINSLCLEEHTFFVESYNHESNPSYYNHYWNAVYTLGTFMGDLYNKLQIIWNI